MQSSGLHEHMRATYREAPDHTFHGFQSATWRKWFHLYSPLTCAITLIEQILKLLFRLHTRTYTRSLDVLH